MAGNVPQSIEQVEALALKLDAQGLFRRPASIKRGDCVRVKRMGHTVCAVVESKCGPTAPELFAVVTVCGRWLVASAFIFVCPGAKGQPCACRVGRVPSPAQRDATRPGASMPPLGNTGVTA